MILNLKPLHCRYRSRYLSRRILVLILDGNSEIGETKKDRERCERQREFQEFLITQGLNAKILVLILMVTQNMLRTHEVK